MRHPGPEASSGPDLRNTRRVSAGEFWIIPIARWVTGALDEGKERVPNGNVGTDEVPDVGDDPPDDIGLPLRAVQVVGGGEATIEYERLELQPDVE